MTQCLRDEPQALTSPPLLLPVCFILTESSHVYWLQGRQGSLVWLECVHDGEIQGRQAEGEGKQVTRGPVHLAESDRRRLGEP